MGYYMWAYANKLRCQYLAEKNLSADATSILESFKWSKKLPHVTGP
jgi:hypothetical protein